jgi:hypothetical protein
MYKAAGVTPARGRVSIGKPIGRRRAKLRPSPRLLFEAEASWYSPESFGTHLAWLLQRPLSSSQQHHQRKNRRIFPLVISTFDRCVFNRESGEPGSTSLATIRWHIVDPPYEGAAQWVASTFRIAAEGISSASAANSTPTQQIRAFDRYEPSHPGSWPVSVPACGG